MKALLLRLFNKKPAAKNVVYVRRLKRQYTINGITVNDYEIVEEVAA